MNALWLTCIYSSADLLANVLPNHPLFSLPGVTIHTLWPDLMHVKYMGVDMHFYGSVLVVLVLLLETHGPAESYGERLETVWRHCNQYYTDNSVDKPSRFTNMRIGMFTRESCWRNMFPKLKGRAAEVKHLGPL